MSQGLRPVDKTGRLPDWCEDEEGGGEDAGLEAMVAADDAAVEAAADVLVAAEMAEEAAELTGCGLEAAVQVVEPWRQLCRLMMQHRRH